MLKTPMDVSDQFPVRRSGAQKQAFRDAVQRYAKSLGYPCAVEEGSFGCRNLVIGDPRRAKYLVTAHYDTCARMMLPNILIPDNPLLYALYQIGLNLLAVLVAALSGILLGIAAMFLYAFATPATDGLELGALGILVFFIVFFVLLLLAQLSVYFGPSNQHNANDNTSGVVTVLEIARTLPENLRDKVCFVLFDLNEAGLLGSRAYQKAHKAETARQIVVNLSCVGDGDNLCILPGKGMKQDRAKYNALFKCCGYFGPKSLLVMEKGLSLIPSDHTRFPYGASVMAFRKGKIGHYITRIHTPKDTMLDQTNINILRAAVTTLISSDAAQ